MLGVYESGAQRWGTSLVSRQPIAHLRRNKILADIPTLVLVVIAVGRFTDL